ncbi:MAG: DUF2341 domain-containing protein [Kofleriaceae bacterium]
MLFVRVLAIAAASAACYSPTISEGVPCNEQRQCPDRQLCDADGICRSSALADARLDDAVDAPIDLATWDGCVPGEASCDWTARSRVYIDGRESTVDLVDVTIPLILDVSRFDFSRAQANGSDLRISDGATPLELEIETWSTTSAVIWVRIPRVEPQLVGATVVLYYGNPLADAPPATTAWATDYVGVWHLATSAYADATSNDNDGVASGSVLLTPGTLGTAARFSGTSFIDVGTDSVLALTTTGTLSAWVRFSNTTQFASPIGKTQFGDPANYSYAFQRNGDGAGQLGLVVSNGSLESEANSATPTVLDQWAHFTGRWGAAGLQMFIDGVPSGASSPAVTAQVANAHRVRIGCSFAPTCTSGGGVDGTIDEVRISRVARSNDWIRFDVAAMRDRVATFQPVELR